MALVTNRPSRLVMLGPAPGTPGTIAELVAAYQACGLFKRWPIHYVATHGASTQGATRLSLNALRRFLELLVREPKLVVHVHLAVRQRFALEALFVALALAARCRLVLHLHDAGLERLRDGLLGRRLIRFVLERAACVLVPCESMAAWVGSLTRNAQVVCVPYPVMPHEPALGERPNLVVSTATLSEDGGAADLMNALAEVRSAVPDVRLVCAAGEGESRALAQHARRLGIEDAVKFTGWVGPSGKRALFESAAVFALPSSEETLPMTLLQAMGAGVPVVATSAGALPEVIAHGVTGFLVPAGDTASLRRLLRKLLLDHELGARIGAAARESVRRRFAPERAIARLEAVYAEAGLCALDAEPASLREAGIKAAT
jgi:glycosyltransferase involved in cell wall biosynthesis